MTIAIDIANELMKIILAPMMLSFGTMYFLGTSKLESFSLSELVLEFSGFLPGCGRFDFINQTVNSNYDCQQSTHSQKNFLGSS